MIAEEEPDSLPGFADSLRAQHARERRQRMLDAMVQLACEWGFDGASVTLLCARAKTSRRAFYEEFESRQACFLAVLDDGLRQANTLVEQAFARVGEQAFARAGEQAFARARERAVGEPGGGGLARRGRVGCGPRAKPGGIEETLAGLRGALAALLQLMDERPGLARVWMIEAPAAGAWALAHRERNVQALTERIVAHWGTPPDSKAIVPEAVMAAVLGLIQRHMLSGSGEPLLSLTGQLMGVVATPYLDGRQVQEEVERARTLALHMRCQGRAPPAREDAPEEILRRLRNPRAHRARRCLRFLASHPGASNRQVGSAVGIHGHSQVSALLGRLAREGLLCKRAGAPGQANAWWLTPSGMRAAGTLESAPSGAIGARDERIYESTGETDEERTVTS